MASTIPKDLLLKLLELRKKVKQENLLHGEQTNEFTDIKEKYQVTILNYNNNIMKTSSKWNKTLVNIKAKSMLDTTSPIHAVLPKYDITKTQLGNIMVVNSSNYDELDTTNTYYLSNYDKLYYYLNYLKLIINVLIKHSLETTHLLVGDEKEWLIQVHEATDDSNIYDLLVQIQSYKIHDTVMNNKIRKIRLETVGKTAEKFVNEFNELLNNNKDEMLNIFKEVFENYEKEITIILNNCVYDRGIYKSNLAKYNISKITVDKTYDEIVTIMGELQFMETGKIPVPKSIDDAVNSLEAWLKTIKYNDTIDPKLLKYQMIDKLVSLEKDLGKILEKDYTKDDVLAETRLCGLEVPGKICLSVLTNCLNGATSDDCLNKWRGMDWSHGIKFENSDRGAVIRLAEKLTLDTNDVKTVVDEYVKKMKKSLDPRIVTSLHAIKSVVHSNSKTATTPLPPPQGQYWSFLPINSLIQVAGGKMSGGGSTVSYADFIRGVDSLRNNIHMSGAGPNTAVAIRNSFNQLKTILTNNNKKFDEKDEMRIDEYLNSVENSEKRLVKLDNMITMLSKLYKNSSDKDELNKEITTDLTLQVMDELVERHKKSSSALTNKANNLYHTWENIIKMPAIMDMLTNLNLKVEEMSKKLP